MLNIREINWKERSLIEFSLLSIDFLLETFKKAIEKMISIYFNWCSFCNFAPQSKSIDRKGVAYQFTSDLCSFITKRNLMISKASLRKPMLYHRNPIAIPEKKKKNMEISKKPHRNTSGGCQENGAKTPKKSGTEKKTPAMTLLTIWVAHGLPPGKMVCVLFSELGFIDELDKLSGGSISWTKKNRPGRPEKNGKTKPTSWKTHLYSYGK